MFCEFQSLNRTYTISKENTDNRGDILERQKWDKKHNVSSKFISNERQYLTNESNATPAWIEYPPEKL